jgi:hypothetical protein
VVASILLDDARQTATSDSRNSDGSGATRKTDATQSSEGERGGWEQLPLEIRFTGLNVTGAPVPELAMVSKASFEERIISCVIGEARKINSKPPLAVVDFWN